MVTLLVPRRVCTLLAVLTLAVPATADGVLEQLQREVASIASHTKNAVVSVEDERAVIAYTMANAPAPTNLVPFADSYQPSKDIEDKLAHLRINLDAANKEIARQEEQVKTGLLPLGELTEPKARRAHIEQDIKTYDRKLHESKNLAITGLDISTLNAFDVPTQAKLAWEEFTRYKKKQEEIEDELTHLRTMYSEAHPKMQDALKRKEANQKRLQDAAQQWQHVSAKAAAPNRQQPGTTTYLGFKSGSGFSVGDGYIVTTSDVLEGMGSPIVITDNGTRIKARIVGMNTDLNVGLLKLLAKTDVPALKMGDSDGVAVGHFAISVGNQSGQANSVALMLVGGIRNEGTYAGAHFYPSLIQIAGTVGAGTSGAPLLSARGEVIGMMAAVPAGVNTMSTTELGSLAAQGYYPYREYYGYRPGSATSNPPTPSQQVPANGLFGIELGAGDLSANALPSTGMPGRAGDSVAWQAAPGSSARQNLNLIVTPAITSAGFAIPINEIKGIVEELRSGKPLVRGWIGIAPKDEIQVVEQESIISLNRTVRVEGIFPESPAFRSGLQPGDVLVSMNGKPMQSASDVREVSVRLRPGATLAVVFRRGSRQQTVSLKIEPRPATVKPPITAPIKDGF